MHVDEMLCNYFLGGGGGVGVVSNICDARDCLDVDIDSMGINTKHIINDYRKDQCAMSYGVYIISNYFEEKKKMLELI